MKRAVASRLRFDSAVPASNPKDPSLPALPNKTLWNETEQRSKVSHFSEEYFISTARERAWMLKLGNGGQCVFYLDNPRDYEQT